MFFGPYRQDERVGSMNFYVRTSGDPAQLLRAIPAVMARLDPNLPRRGSEDDAAAGTENVFLDRMISTLSAAFALLATLLAAVGLYGVLAYRSRSARARSACAWRSAPTARAFAGWSRAGREDDARRRRRRRGRRVLPGTWPRRVCCSS